MRISSMSKVSTQLRHSAVIIVDLVAHQLLQYGLFFRTDRSHVGIFDLKCLYRVRSRHGSNYTVSAQYFRRED